MDNKGLRGNNIAAAFLHNASVREGELFLKLSAGGEPEVFTFGQIRDQACRYNAHFRKSAMPKGSVVAIILKHSVDLYTAFLGAIMAGMVPTIMPFPTPKQDPEKHWTSHRALFGLSGIDSVFTYPDNVDDIRRYLGDQVNYLSTHEDVDAALADDRIESGELAVLQHSSGTTALKKGVMLTHEAIFNQVRSYSKSLGLDANSRIVTWLPLYHDMGFIACFLMPMIVGCPVSHIDAFVWSARPTLLLDEIDAFGGEFVWLPNFAYNHIANSVRASREWDLGTVKAIINCSEPCKPGTFETFRAVAQFRNLAPEALQVCYAMAENVFAVSQTDLTAQPRVVTVSTESFREGRRVEVLAANSSDAVTVLSCGRIIDGTDVAVLDEAGELSRDEGLLGQIAIAGNSLYSGYYKRPEITAERLVDGWHRTGDIGFLEGGELFVTGRVDDLLIIRGKNIYAHEVEEAVNALGLVIPGRAVAFSVFSKDKGEASLVILAEGQDLEAEGDIRKSIRRAVEAGFGVPLGDFRLFPARTLRKTTSGKLSRKDNAELYQETRT